MPPPLSREREGGRGSGRRDGRKGGGETGEKEVRGGAKRPERRGRARGGVGVRGAGVEGGFRAQICVISYFSDIVPPLSAFLPPLSE